MIEDETLLVCEKEEETEVEVGAEVADEVRLTEDEALVEAEPGINELLDDGALLEEVGEDGAEVAVELVRGTKEVLLEVEGLPEEEMLDELGLALIVSELLLIEDEALLEAELDTIELLEDGAWLELEDGGLLELEDCALLELEDGMWPELEDGIPLKLEESALLEVEDRALEELEDGGRIELEEDVLVELETDVVELLIVLL